MQDSEFDLPGVPLLGTSVNSGARGSLRNPPPPKESELLCASWRSPASLLLRQLVVVLEEVLGLLGIKPVIDARRRAHRIPSRGECHELVRGWTTQENRPARVPIAGAAVPKRRVLRELQVVLREGPEQLGGEHPDPRATEGWGTASRIVSAFLTT